MNFLNLIYPIDTFLLGFKMIYFKFLTVTSFPVLSFDYKHAELVGILYVCVCGGEMCAHLCAVTGHCLSFVLEDMCFVNFITSLFQCIISVPNTAPLAVYEILPYNMKIIGNIDVQYLFNLIGEGHMLWFQFLCLFVGV